MLKVKKPINDDELIGFYIIIISFYFVFIVFDKTNKPPPKIVLIANKIVPIPSLKSK